MVQRIQILIFFVVPKKANLYLINSFCINMKKLTNYLCDVKQLANDSFCLIIAIINRVQLNYD